MSLFGTNGVRGIANKEITPEFALDLAKSIGTFKRGTIVIGRDTRVSGDMLKSASIAGLLSTGCEVIDLGIAPTPTIQYYVKNHNVSAGIVITASHNPSEYNGIKLVASDGTEASREDERRVENIYYEKKFKIAEWNETGNLKRDNSAIDLYKKGIIKLVDSEKRKILKNAKLKVVIDAGCGAGALVTPFLLRELGCKVITLNTQNDGTFPGRNPEPTPDNLEDLINLVQSTDANLGIAHDGDADRSVFVDENGNFVDEDVLLAFVAKYYLQNSKYSKKIIVTPVSSSQRIADVTEEYNGELIWTAVGSIYVARKMMETGAIFGGEGNGGLIFPEHQYCRDGAMSAAKILEIVASGKKLSELVNDIPKYYNAKTKIKCMDKDIVVLMKQIIKELKEDSNIINSDTTDGIKAWYKDGWVLIRPSGTEPLIRVFAESSKESTAKKLMEYGKKRVEELCEK
ncbi:MAG TPA: phosphoglucosamine mutase [Methanosarcinales archaeon]|nr:phosphoglucosamine mutase [Methanosarcinales archaeon]